MYSIENYTERSFVVRLEDGNEFKNIESLLVQKGGLVNYKLKGGYGIIFHISKKNMIEKILQEYNPSNKEICTSSNDNNKTNVKVYDWSISKNEYTSILKRLEQLEFSINKKETNNNKYINHSNIKENDWKLTKEDYISVIKRIEQLENFMKQVIDNKEEIIISEEVNENATIKYKIDKEEQKPKRLLRTKLNENNEDKEDKEDIEENKEEKVKVKSRLLKSKVNENSPDESKKVNNEPKRLLRTKIDNNKDDKNDKNDVKVKSRLLKSKVNNETKNKSITEYVNIVNDNNIEDDIDIEYL